MTEGPIGPDNAEIARFLERRALERAVVDAAVNWSKSKDWLKSDRHDDLLDACDRLTAFDAVHPDVSSPARAAAGPDPEAPLSASPGPAVPFRFTVEPDDA